MCFNDCQESLIDILDGIRSFCQKFNSQDASSLSNSLHSQITYNANALISPALIIFMIVDPGVKLICGNKTFIKFRLFHSFPHYSKYTRGHL